MKSNFISSLIFVSLLSNLAMFVACSTNPLLTENIQLNSQDKTRIELELNRSLNRVERSSDLNNFVYPAEDELLAEADFKNPPLYSQNLQVLSDWISRDLSSRQRMQLSQNCEFLVGSFDTKFPLDESTIACAAWWVEKRNAVYVQEQKIKAFDENAPVRMTDKKKWSNFQYLSLTQAIALIDLDTAGNVQYYTKEAFLYADDCTLKNANAALLLKLENFLSNPQTYLDIEKIYTKMQSCLIPNEEPAEKIHLRMGLLRLLQGKTDLAFDALKKTQLETDPKENSRNLFWLGAIYKKNNPTQKSNPYWEQLVKENALSLAALVANQQMGVDPRSILVGDERISLQNRDGEGWSKENLEAFIFEIFLARKNNDAASIWANYVSRNMTTTNPNFILYWVLTQNKLYNYSTSIQLMSRYARYQKNYLVSRGLIRLQFPMPYLREILSVNSPVDPIFTLALMRQESAFDENARSPANARGLMQVLPNTAKTVRKFVRPNDLYNPDTNIELGDALLEKLFRKYNGKSEYVLASYNAGSSNLDRWLNRVPSENTMLFSDFIPFKETRNYVSIILRNYYWYSVLLSESNDRLAQSVLERSQNSRFKSERVQALLASSIASDKNALTESQKNLLNRIYIFGDELLHLNALSMRSQHPKPHE